MQKNILFVINLFYLFLTIQSNKHGNRIHYNQLDDKEFILKWYYIIYYIFVAFLIVFPEKSFYTWELLWMKCSTNLIVTLISGLNINIYTNLCWSTFIPIDFDVTFTSWLFRPPRPPPLPPSPELFVAFTTKHSQKQLITIVRINHQNITIVRYPVSIACNVHIASYIAMEE